MSGIDIDWAFASTYPLPAVRSAMRASLEARGLEPSLARNPRTVLQWCPYRKTSWQRAANGTLLVSSYRVHYGLAYKCPLFEALRQYVASAAAGETATHEWGRAGPQRAVEHVRAALLESRSVNVCTAGDSELDFIEGDEAWVLKASEANNATGVLFFKGRKEGIDQLALLRSSAEKGGGSSAEKGGDMSSGVAPAWLLQRHVDNPALIDGRKFTLRVNALAVGCLELWVHREVLAHIASEAYGGTSAGFDNAFAHVTNAGTQHAHPLYSRERNQLSLHEVESKLGAVLWDQVCGVVEGVVRAFHPHRRTVVSGFHPMPDAFELFGFDFAVEEMPGDGPMPGRRYQVKLLEVNSGPMLAGSSDESLCRRIVEDATAVIVDRHLLPALRSCDGGAVASAAVGGPPFEDVGGFHHVYSRGVATCNGSPLVLSSRFTAFLSRVRADLGEAAVDVEQGETSKGQEASKGPVSSLATGRMAWGGFKAGAQRFALVLRQASNSWHSSSWHDLLGSWEWIEDECWPLGPSAEGGGYLVRRSHFVRRHRPDKASRESWVSIAAEEDTMTAHSDDAENAPDDGASTSATELDLCDYECHVVFNLAYNVPTLFFRASHFDGTPCDPKEVIANLAIRRPETKVDDLRTVVAQELHPNLHTPFFLVHPCRTSEWMMHLVGTEPCFGCPTSPNDSACGTGRFEALYLLSWLGVVGAVLGRANISPPPELHAAARSALQK